MGVVEAGTIQHFKIHLESFIYIAKAMGPQQPVMVLKTNADKASASQHNTDITLANNIH